jgi:hypothetical protein
LTPATEVELENLLRSKDEQLPVPTRAQIIERNEPGYLEDPMAIDPAWGETDETDETDEEPKAEEPKEPTGNWETGPTLADLSAIEQEGA